ncbi:MAG: lycopene cyclase family protein [Emticicia sp.]|nr:lycopene cyclase family protein [Emticicia sp.]
MKSIKKYDFIICGGGMSGLSLAYYLQKSTLGNKPILIIEPQEKNKNDRTWAFWEAKKGTFEDILYRKWHTVNFRDASNKIKKLDIGDYHYKLLRGIDFYNFVTAELQKSPNIQFIKDSVNNIEDADEYAIVKTAAGQTYKANFVFDSTYKLKLNIPKNHNLLQHFKGLVIRSEKPVFDPALPEMMDFGVEQFNECRFMYVLPFDAHTAIVEYTLFTERLLEEKEYDAELKKYISEKLKITAGRYAEAGVPQYQVIEDEFGVIPMSDEATNEFPSKHVVRIGTAGGYTNPATGYTFQNTQKRLKALVEQLEKTGSPVIKTSWFQKRFFFYSSVLLNVLEQKRLPAAEVFGRLYERNPASQIFKFLDGETTLWEDIKIMWSTKKLKFIAAVIDVVRRKY